MLQTANVLNSNSYTRPIGCRVLAVKCSKNDHQNLEECTRQLTRMMDLMPSYFTAVNSTLHACTMIPNQQNDRSAIQLLNHLLGLPNRASSRYFQERSSTVTFILKFFLYRIVNLLNVSSVFTELQAFLPKIQKDLKLISPSFTRRSIDRCFHKFKL